jgi:protein-S-isoprenylcysteine O-methyltransferase Ste14
VTSSSTALTTSTTPVTLPRLGRRPLRLAAVGRACRVLAGRALPAFLFAFVAAGNVTRLQQALEQGAGGTGLADVAGRYATLGHEALSAAFMGAVAVLFVVRKQPVRKQPGLAPRVAALLGTYIVFALGVQPVTSQPWWVLLAASLLLVAGTACAVVTVLVLGRCFGIMPEARGLVTSGPYRFVRHPLYTSEALFVLGMLLPVLSPLSLAIWGAYLGLTALRARYEEVVLLAAFPDYAAYRRRTWRFLPGMY